MSYTKKAYGVNKNFHLVPLYTIHIYFRRPDSYREETFDLASGKNYKTIAITRGTYCVVHDFATDRIYPINYCPTNPYDYFGILFPKRVKKVRYNGKPALLYTEMEQSNGIRFAYKQVWYDTHTHETLQMILNDGDWKLLTYQREKIIYSDWKLNPKLPATMFYLPAPDNQPN